MPQKPSVLDIDTGLRITRFVNKEMQDLLYSIAHALASEGTPAAQIRITLTQRFTSVPERYVSKTINRLREEGRV